MIDSFPPGIPSLLELRSSSSVFQSMKSPPLLAMSSRCEEQTVRYKYEPRLTDALLGSTKSSGGFALLEIAALNELDIGSV